MAAEDTPSLTEEFLGDTHRSFQSEVLRLYFPLLEPWVAWSVSLPSCSSQFIYTQMWNCQPPPHPPGLSASALPCPLHAGCPSLPLLPVWMNISSLAPWLSNFHTVQFSVSSSFLVLNWLFSFFWLCEEVRHIYLCLHLGHKNHSKRNLKGKV